MRILVLVLSLFFGMQSFAQKECVYSAEVNDSIGSYVETKGYLMHEKVFGGKSTYLFFSLANENGTPFLKVEQIEKSADFIAATCFDKKSKLSLILATAKKT